MRVRKTPKVTITVGKEAYEGNTKTEATARALDHLADFMNGEGFMPIVVHAPNGAVGVVFRDGNGYWSYLIHRPDQTHSPCIISAIWSRDQAERRLRYHLAQDAYEHGKRETITTLVKVDEDVRDLFVWADFQDTYFNAIAEGASPDEALKIVHKPSFQP